jgi:hypothetical protein
MNLINKFKQKNKKKFTINGDLKKFVNEAQKGDLVAQDFVDDYSLELIADVSRDRNGNKVFKSYFRYGGFVSNGKDNIAGDIAERTRNSCYCFEVSQERILDCSSMEYRLVNKQLKKIGI